MLSDPMYLITLFVFVPLVAYLAVRLFRPLSITLTVGEGRQVTIGGQAFPEDGPARSEESFSVPLKLTTEQEGDIVLSVEPVAGEGASRISIARRRLRSLHIDAALPAGLIVYGGYETALMMMRSLAYSSTTKCIQCGDVTVCGTMPRCR